MVVDVRHCTRPCRVQPARRSRRPSLGARCCWCMVELHHLLLLPPAIGADLEHCLMKLLAAPSTSETELSLNVPFDVGARGGELGLNKRALRASWSSGDAAASAPHACSPASSSSSLQASWSSRGGLASTASRCPGGPLKGCLSGPCGGVRHPCELCYERWWLSSLDPVLVLGCRGSRAEAVEAPNLSKVNLCVRPTGMFHDWCRRDS